jgi:hypothetical protein
MGRCNGRKLVIPSQNGRQGISLDTKTAKILDGNFNGIVQNIFGPRIYLDSACRHPIEAVCAAEERFSHEFVNIAGGSRIRVFGVWSADGIRHL